MKKAPFTTALLFFVAIQASAQVRVACIGDGLTSGGRMVNHEKNNYPSQLQHMLGKDYVVKNFGSDTATFSINPDVKAFRPDVVLVGFEKSEIKDADFLRSFTGKNLRPRLLILAPPAFPGQTYDAGSLENIAKSAGAEVISLQPLFDNRKEFFQDSAQIASIGASAIARRIYMAVTKKTRVNFAALPAPGSEYRSGAGWKPGKDWWAQHENIDSLLLAAPKPDVLFVGNSITQAIGGHRTQTTSRAGFAAFDSIMKGRSWECAGISGDRVQNVAWRLQNGAYRQAAPRLIVLAIGVNNFPDDEAEDVAEGIRQTLEWLVNNMPSTKVLLLGPLPAGLKPGDMRREKFERTHAIISRYKFRNVHYLSLAGTFILPNGDLDPERCSKDGIHLQAAGYRAWANALKPVIDKMLE